MRMQQTGHPVYIGPTYRTILYTLWSSVNLVGQVGRDELVVEVKQRSTKLEERVLVKRLSENVTYVHIRWQP